MSQPFDQAAVALPPRRVASVNPGQAQEIPATAREPRRGWLSVSSLHHQCGGRSVDHVMHAITMPPGKVMRHHIETLPDSGDNNNFADPIDTVTQYLYLCVTQTVAETEDGDRDDDHAKGIFSYAALPVSRVGRKEWH